MCCPESKLIMDIWIASLVPFERNNNFPLWRTHFSFVLYGRDCASFPCEMLLKCVMKLKMDYVHCICLWQCTSKQRKHVYLFTFLSLIFTLFFSPKWCVSVGIRLSLIRCLTTPVGSTIIVPLDLKVPPGLFIFNWSELPVHFFFFLVIKTQK